MPKTQAEKETLPEFQSEYGPKKGKQVYFALRNKNKKFDRSQGGGYSAKSFDWLMKCFSIFPRDKHSELSQAYANDILKSSRPICFTEFAGFPIGIETPQGCIRYFKGGQTRMKNSYGFFVNTMGVDGDEVDCYLGPNPDSGFVYAVRQLKPDSGEFDEVKVMLGFDTIDAAKEAYMKHYDNERFYGGIKPYSVEEFKKILMQTVDNPAVLKSHLKAACANI